LLTAIGLTPSGSSAVHIYTKTIHKTTQLTTLIGRLSGIVVVVVVVVGIYSNCWKKTVSE